jgi:hypothetical protein
MSARQADDLFSHLDRTTIVSYCGEVKPVPPREARDRRDPRNVLDYPSGYFLFESGGSVLVETGVQTPGADKFHTVWENVHRTPAETATDPNERVMIMMAEMHAKLGGISVYEYEGRVALKILENTPCLAGLSTRY